MAAHVIQILSVDTSATQGRPTRFASWGNMVSSHVGSDTRKKSNFLFFSPNSLTRSRSCSAKASFWTSCSMNSALATKTYHFACTRSEMSGQYNLSPYCLRACQNRINCLPSEIDIKEAHLLPCHRHICCVILCSRLHGCCGVPSCKPLRLCANAAWVSAWGQTWHLRRCRRAAAMCISPQAGTAAGRGRCDASPLHQHHLRIQLPLYICCLGVLCYFPPKVCRAPVTEPIRSSARLALPAGRILQLDSL